jgi:hypothetical protein
MTGKGGFMPEKAILMTGRAVLMSAGVNRISEGAIFVTN